jgi:hypothetical protein
MKSNGT